MRAQMNLVAAVGAVAVMTGSALAGDALVRRASAANLFVQSPVSTDRDTRVFYPGQIDDEIRTGTFNLEKSTNGGSTYESFKTYCVEVGKPAPPASGEINYMFRPLSDRFTPAEENVLRIVWKNAFALSQTSAINAAAFQIIIWELASDNSFMLSAVAPPATQNFWLAQQETLAGQAGQIAQTWYNNAMNGAWTTMADLTLLVNDDASAPGADDWQDLIMEMGGGTSIPLPTAGLMGTVGLLGLVSVRRRATRA